MGNRQQPTIEEVLEKHMEDRPSKIIEESYLESVYDAMKDWASIETEHLRQKLHKYELAITSLTPGGSEYVNDPQRCVDFVRADRESKHKFLAQQVKENKTLIERIKELEGK